MIILYNSESECCGCGACEAICPKANIKMVTAGDGGYFYPKYLGDDNCINCQLCLKVCPMKLSDSKQETSFEPVFLAGYTNDINLWMTSSSGGAFTEICEANKDKNPVVFGARWEGFEVVMDFNENGDTECFRKSKYVEVNPNQNYSKVKSFLDKGRYVIYSGTPCQINGLRAFLRKNYDNLLTIDFACHGQGAPVVFRKWLKHLEEKYGKPLVAFKLREKKKIKDHINSNCTTYEFADGTTYTTTRDYYHHAYVKGLHMRKSCANCRFAANRLADITLADFKNVREGWPEALSERNISTIICNTEKGYDAVNRIENMTMRKSDKDFVLKYNPKLHTVLPGNPQRDNFMDEIDNGEILSTIKKYCRIFPSEWIEYNCSEKFANKIRKVSIYLDVLARQLYRLM